MFNSSSKYSMVSVLKLSPKTISDNIDVFPFSVIGFLTLCFTILLEDPTKHLETQSKFIYGIFLFFVFCDHANRLIGTAFEIQGDICREQNHQNWLFNIAQRQRSDQIISDLKSDEAYSVDIQDLVIKMGHHVNLRISKLNIEPGEIIRKYTDYKPWDYLNYLPQLF